MSLTNDQITAQNFKDYHNAILPYLNGQCPPIANKFSKGDMYSTDEKIVGQWIDGKPLYQKTFSGKFSGTSVTLINDTSGIEIHGVVGYCNYASGKSVSIPWYNGTDNKIIVSEWESVYFLECTSLYISGNYQVTIRYTKTTDDPIAIGDESDYSTTEHIVGTWIDGKPIYQKTIAGLDYHLSSSWAIISEITTSNIGQVINAFACRSQDGSFLPLTAYIVSNNFKVCSGAEFNNVDIITLQYTKTTDV